ncbi:MAG TPA: hypothetical protein DEQ84_00825 [Prevotellaceae bacterium]|nr:hypothetical protein [Prevotellaceae bacterium]
MVKVQLRVAEAVAYLLAAVPNGAIGYIEQKSHIAIAEAKDTKNYHMLILCSEKGMVVFQAVQQVAI